MQNKKPSMGEGGGVWIFLELHIHYSLDMNIKKPIFHVQQLFLPENMVNVPYKLFLGLDYQA